jgi:DNA-binding transcriptional regulator YiaG
MANTKLTPIPTKEELPAVIKDTREQMGLSQERFAVMVDATALTVRSWEQGRSEPSLKHYRLLLQATRQK